MSVSSIRKVAGVALADKKITLAEAEKLTFTAGRTSGVSAGEKKELAKVLAAATSFSPGAKAHLAATAAAQPTSGAPTKVALEQLVNSRGLDAVSDLEDADEDSFSDALKAGLEKFAEVLGSSDGDTVAYSARKLQVGRETLYVVNDFDWDKDRELVGFLDESGKEIARASINRHDEGMTMNWESLSGGRRGAPIGTPSAHAGDSLPTSFKRELEAWVEAKNGDELGQSVEANELPPEVRHAYESLVRTTADGTGAEKFVFKGTKIYALHDYSCVSSSHFYTESGKKVLQVTNG